MAICTQKPFRGLPGGFQPLLQLWVLRLLVECEGHRYVLDERRVTEGWVFRFLDIKVEEKDPSFNPQALLTRLRQRLDALSKLSPRAPRSAMLSKNLSWLAESLGLTAVEQDIVQFLAAVHHCHALDNLLEKFGTLRTHEVHALLAIVLDHPFEKVSAALLHNSRLIRSGLVWSELVTRWNFQAKVGLLAGVPDQLTLRHADPFELFMSNFKRAKPTTLTPNDFEHLSEDLAILAAYLQDSLASGTNGVNILFHGPPGTGKTELVKALAQNLGAPLFEVAVEDRCGNIHKGEARFGAFQLAQGVLGGKPRPLILFDEIEDVFRGAEDGNSELKAGNRSGRKAWVNKLLAENRIPSIWVSNTIGVLDRAFVRRFDYVLEVGIPPRSVRSRVLERYTSDLDVSTGWRARAAEHEALTPAAIERAAKVTRAVLGVVPDLTADVVVDRVLGNALEALGASRHPRHAATSLTKYRLDILNADRDLGAIRDGLRRTRSGRLCLYGPPGTGKTAFGHHLAHELDRPLHLHRASDLLSAYLGETEALMARMFRRATDDGAVLLLDEADTFLRDRCTAQRSWEVSQVNEMLTQLESYEGIFVASTNLMDDLDPASLRRFDVKVRFGFLNPDQRLSMFQDCLGSLGLPADAHAEHTVAGLSRLTPGDFANVLRQARLEPPLTAHHLADLLVQECAMKTVGPRRAIGF